MALRLVFPAACSSWLWVSGAHAAQVVSSMTIAMQLRVGRRLKLCSPPSHSGPHTTPPYVSGSPAHPNFKKIGVNAAAAAELMVGVSAGPP